LRHRCLMDCVEITGRHPQELITDRVSEDLPVYILGEVTDTC